LGEAARATDRIYETVERLSRSLTGIERAAPDAGLIETFRREMDDDFNTPRALALIFDEMRALNRLLDERKTRATENRGAAALKICDTLGLLHDGYAEGKKQRFLKKGSLSLSEIENLVSLRDRARQEKNWREADRIREYLNQRGILLEDTPEGTMWKVK
jgi:cysteinyl-tRNA synthetase